MLINGDAIVAVQGSPGTSALVAALRWIEELLLGTVGTTIAVIAVAAFGLATLSGRIDLRRGATVVVGCFILFGARSIAAGMRDAAARSSVHAGPQRPVQAPPTYAIEPRAPIRPAPSDYDPYAGAALPE